MRCVRSICCAAVVTHAEAVPWRFPLRNFPRRGYACGNHTTTVTHAETIRHWRNIPRRGYACGNHTTLAEHSATRFQMRKTYGIGGTFCAAVTNAELLRHCRNIPRRIYACCVKQKPYRRSVPCRVEAGENGSNIITSDGLSVLRVYMRHGMWFYICGGNV